ncbi:MAG TPA: efflux RND transporter periplasmic adaptor subunit, partial [Leeuwenhoekiella sp.]|nr:efflux RND transporter periplasmic adaptor subunit [Leeuwenhoekiella sp.]
MNRKTLIIILVAAVVLIAALIGGKKAGWFGKTGEFKPVETQEIALATVVETVAATG